MRLLFNGYVTFMLYKLSILFSKQMLEMGPPPNGCSYIWCHKRGTTVTIKIGGVKSNSKLKLYDAKLNLKKTKSKQ